MEKVFTFFNQIPADKARHALLGGCGSCVVLLLFIPFLTLLLVCALAVVLVSTVGAWKEWIYDAAHKENHTPELLDWLVTTAGGAAPALPLFVYALFF